MGDEAGMGGEPLPDEFAVMDRDVVGEQVDGRDRGGDGLVEVLQEGEVLDLAFAAGGDAVDVAGAGVEGGEQVGGASALVLVLDLQGTTGLRRRVATRRGRGWSEVISSRLSTTSCTARGRVSRSATARTCAANAASRGVRGWSQTCDRQGFKRLEASSRCTVWGEIDATTSSRTSCRASSAQSHWLKDRPACSGSSHARRTRCSATSGGKGPRPTRPRTILQTREAARAIPIHPGPHDVRSDPDLASDPIQRHPIRRQQNDPRPTHQPGRYRRPPRHALYCRTPFSVQLDYSATAWSRHQRPSTEFP